MSSMARTLIGAAAAMLVLMGSALGAGTASLLPNGQQQFTDSNGAPLAGGSVYFYYPATTTAKPTWQDPLETTPNANPVVLNSAGRAVIYGSGMYRQVVHDQYGNLIWDQLTNGIGSGGQNINTPINGPVSIASCNGIFPIVNTSGTAITITMPANPSVGDTCEFVDAGANAGAYAITFSFGANVISGGASSYVMSGSTDVISFTWLGTPQQWAQN